MNLDEALKHTAVIGAAGKMGSGISLLLLEEMALLEARATGYVGKGKYRLDLIDVNPAALDGLKDYLYVHVRQMAERQINTLRHAFAGNPQLVSNEDIVEAFVRGAMNIIHPATSIEDARGAVLIFEAVAEDLAVKEEVYRRLAFVNTQPFFVFCNTSSIPIHVLNERGNLQERVIGYHFYNPPAVQKLVELIPLPNGEPLLYEWGYELAKRLKKRIVLSKDLAGFIGNGFFVREALIACAKVRELSTRYSPAQALYIVNKVTQEFLLRPMGVFQLLDYVGIDVASKIGSVMNAYLPQGSYDDEMIEAMVNAGIIGGQYPDGSQKNGFFEYDDHRVKGIYSLKEKRYIAFDENSWRVEADKALGGLPASYIPWKNLHKMPNPEQQILRYFEELLHQKSLGANLACFFLSKDAEIARALVVDGIAHHYDDVRLVLQNGFYHLYGPEEILQLEENICAR